MLTLDNTEQGCESERTRSGTSTMFHAPVKRTAAVIPAHGKQREQRRESGREYGQITGNRQIGDQARMVETAHVIRVLDGLQHTRLTYRNSM